MKHTIRAFALGLLTVSAILGISYLTQDTTDTSAETTPPTNQEMIDHLSSEGYEVSSTTAPEEHSSMDKQPEKESGSENIPENQENTSDESQNEEESSENQDNSEGYQLTVETGMSSMDISRELNEAGLLEDVDSFDDYMQAKDYSRFIQIGTFKVTEDMSYREIADTITSK
ncbi:hypothetical protein [Thalassobacillus hwangdonensis]|uniref:YceG-like family protein n=1 Tax=Thalassobacillus hwangdonensis TaxID=546108 RepID=A0ABW3L2F4_9BACI